MIFDYALILNVSTAEGRRKTDDLQKTPVGAGDEERRSGREVLHPSNEGADKRSFDRLIEGFILVA